MSYKDNIPILVNYQGAHDQNFPSFPLGTEYSHNYSANKGVFLYLYDHETNIAVGLKSFLTSFSVNYQFETEKIKIPNNAAKEEVKNIGASYKLSVKIPAISVNDARVNAARLDTLSIFVDYAGNKNNSGNPRIPRANPIYVLLGNLINNGKYTKKIDITESSQITKYGIECYIKGLDYEIDIDMGFFEYDNKLWPKSYTLNLDFIPRLTVANAEGKIIYLFHDFDDNGNIKSLEHASGSYPFGVKI